MKFLDLILKQACKAGESVCGDYFLSERMRGAQIYVLCDGIGSGAYANIAAIYHANRLMELLRSDVALQDACRLLCRGADFLATNPDLACPTLFGFVPDCGSICAMLENACGRKPVFIGKPDPTMIHLAWAQTGYGPAETLMVGDRLYTDIACGVHAGVDTALVLTGEATAADASVSDTPPTAIYENMAQLLAALRQADHEKGETA